MIKERYRFSQLNFFIEYLSHRGKKFSFFRVNLMSSTNKEKKNSFSRCTNKRFQLKTFSQSCCNMILSKSLSHDSPDKKKTISISLNDFAQKERLDLPYSTMILTICDVTDESNCLDIPIWQFWIIWKYLPFLPDSKQILRPLLVHRNLTIWKWYRWLLLQLFVILMILVQCPSVKKNELLRPSSLLERSHLVCFWFLSRVTSESFQISPILGRLLILLRISS